MKKGHYTWVTLALSLLILGGCHQNLNTGREENLMNQSDTEVNSEEMTEEAIHPSQSDEWIVTFEDSFEGTQLDDSKWEHAPEWERKDGQWSNDEAFLNGEGHLIIQTNEVDGQYYSGAIRTRDLFEQTFGYYEIRANIPKEEGFWTAFWLMSDGVHNVGEEGRDGTEIDIFETPFASRGDIIQHALHWDGYEEHHRSAGKQANVPGIYEGFHTFAVEWNEDEYVFYIDGEETWRTSEGGVSQVPAYMKITSEVGEWAGDITHASLPAQLIVDYVRVYERND